MRKPFMQMEAAQTNIQNSYILHDKMPLCYPFVKWAGGKTQLLSQLYTLAPPEFNRYFEPFLGGGALFFYLISDQNKRFTAYLSDINSELINSYIAVKDNVEKLIKLLKRHEIRYNKAPAEYYYKLRSNDKLPDCIALNRTFITAFIG
jgi:DNA adenine methylase